MSPAAPAATKGGRDDQSASYRRPASQSCAPRWRPHRTRPAARSVASRPSWQPGGLPVGLAAAGTAPPGTGCSTRNTAATTLYTAKCNMGCLVLLLQHRPCKARLLPQLTEGGIRLVAISPAEAGRAANDAAEGQPCLDGVFDPATPPSVTSGSSPRPGRGLCRPSDQTRPDQRQRTAPALCPGP